MKEKVSLVIAVLMITSMAFVISTTTVTAPSTFSVQGGSATLSPTDARASTRIKFTVTVTNDYAADNIDNVRIVAHSGFTQGVGGMGAIENLKLAADNMENAVAPLKRAGENLKLAADNKETAGTAVSSAAANLGSFCDVLGDLGWENRILLRDAATYLGYAGDNMAAASENFTLIAALLENATRKLDNYAGLPDENLAAYNLPAAENLDNAAAMLDNVLLNLKNGSLRAAGVNLAIAGGWLEDAGIALEENSHTARLKLEAAGTNLKTAGQALKDAADYESNAGTNLKSAAAYLSSAADYIYDADNIDLKAASDNLDNAAAQIDVAGDNLSFAEIELEQWGSGRAVLTTEKAHTGSYSVKLTTTDASWDDVAEVKVPYNKLLSTIDHGDLHYWIYSVGTNPQNPYPVLHLDTDGDGIVDNWLHGNRVTDTTKDVWVNSDAPYQDGSWKRHVYSDGHPYGEQAGGAKTIDGWKAALPTGTKVIYVGLQYGNIANGVLYADDITIDGTTYEIDADNLLQAGDNLSNAATYLSDAASELGADLGGDELEDVMEHENAAAENLGVGDVDLGTAGQQLIYAADDLSAAATKFLATANALAPATWTMAEGTGYVQFNAFGDNVIAPGSSRTFAFLWTTPNIDTETDYIISVLVSKEEVTYTSYENLGGFTVTIDGEKPTLIINVTQVGVTPVNVVGTALDNAKATITITASETLQSIDNVYVEDSGNDENFLPPITMTTTDNIVYTGTFTVENWDDNAVVVRVSKFKDLAGNENTNVENTVTVDTRAPIFIDNGLATLISGVRDNVVQAGTGTVFRCVDNSASENMVIIVQDNAAGEADNDFWVTSVTIDTTAATRDPTIENRWTMSMTLSEGFNDIVKVTATDRTGNSESDNVENIFIDTKTPTIEFTTVAGKTWDENSELINDNTPEIKITVTDPGYPTSGLGVAYKVGSGLAENFLWIGLDNNDNIYDNLPAAPYGRLENKATWVVSTGIFENLIDNAGKGLVDGTYWIVVMASDNLGHAGKDNVIAASSFTIDTIKPVKDTDIVVLDKLTLTTIDNPRVFKVAERTIEGTVTSGEVGGTIKVYFNGVHQPTYDLVTTTTTWSRTITLPVGQTTKIQLTLTDKAGNESEKVLYGYAMPDATPPTVTITTPESGISTDATSIILEATVTKDTWEEYSELTVRIDATSLTAPLTATNVLSATGTLTRAVELVEGTNTISVSAQDVAGNWSTVATVQVTRTVTPWATYAIIIVIVALILAAIAIFRKR